jgi:predicted rRNA methylase YqxC with S4 and FtsJ domains
MVKPQFEVGREKIGKGGVVRDPVSGARPRPRRRKRAGPRAPRSWLRVVRAAGAQGELETFVHFAEARRAGAILDLRAAAAEAEPS